MNKLQYLLIAAAVALAYVCNFFVPVAWIGVVAALPLLRIRKMYAFIFGFLIGFIVPTSLYLLYPLSMVGKLSGIVAQIASLPSLVVLLGFSLFYGIIMALSGLFWSGLVENIGIGSERRWYN